MEAGRLSRDPGAWRPCVVDVEAQSADREWWRTDPFEGEEAVLHVIERIVAPLGLRVDATSTLGGRAIFRTALGVQTRFLDALFEVAGPRSERRLHRAGDFLLVSKGV